MSPAHARERQREMRAALQPAKACRAALRRNRNVLYGECRRLSCAARSVLREACATPIVAGVVAGFIAPALPSEASGWRHTLRMRDACAARRQRAKDVSRRASSAQSARERAQRAYVASEVQSLKRAANCRRHRIGSSRPASVFRERDISPPSRDARAARESPCGCASGAAAFTPLPQRREHHESSTLTPPKILHVCRPYARTPAEMRYRAVMSYESSPIIPLPVLQR